MPLRRCVLFDLDGTLIDTAPDLAYAANQLRADAGLPPLPVGTYRPQASHGARGMLGIALQITPEHPDFPARREQFLNTYRAHITRETRPFPGVPALLDTLEAADIPWGIVTNKPGWLTGPVTEALGLAARAGCVVSGDTAARAKPWPDPLLHAARVLAVQPQSCLYVGDDERDIIAGRAAEMTTVAAGWGYLGDQTDPRDWGADHLIQTPAEVLALIERADAA